MLRKRLPSLKHLEIPGGHLVRRTPSPQLNARLLARFAKARLDQQTNSRFVCNHD